MVVPCGFQPPACELLVVMREPGRSPAGTPNSQGDREKRCTSIVFLPNRKAELDRFFRRTGQKANVFAFSKEMGTSDHGQYKSRPQNVLSYTFR